MILQPCVGLWGRAEFKPGTPGILRYDEAVFVGEGDPGTWGLYTRGGCRIRHPGATPDADPGIGPSAWADIAAGARACGEGTFLYIGKVSLHYGHFLIDGLSRLWPLLEPQHRGSTIVVDPHIAVDHLFNTPFIAAVFSALDITRDRVVSFDENVTFKRIFVPQNSFQEQRYAFDMYRRLTRHVGAAIIDAGDLHGDSPLYVSKARLREYVQRVGNEQEVEDTMRDAGLTVVYPETMPLAEQIAMFVGPRVILSMVGSALHTHAFAPLGARIVALNALQDLNANYALIDGINKAAVQYVYDPGRTIEDDGLGRSTVYLSDPRAAARDLLTLAGL